MIRQRTRAINGLRGLMAEYGEVVQVNFALYDVERP